MTSTRRSRSTSPASWACRWPPSVEEVLASDVDAVAVCSTADTHVDLMVAAAEAGKAVFCEKPVSLDLEELERGLDAIETRGVPFQVGFNRRFDPAHASVQEAVAAGRIGEPHLVRISSRDPEPPTLEYVRTSGGLFLDMMIHDFDMARFVTGIRGRGGVRPRRGPGRPGVRRRRATSTPRSSRWCTPAAASPRSTTAARPPTASISAWRRSAPTAWRRRRTRRRTPACSRPPRASSARRSHTSSSSATCPATSASGGRSSSALQAGTAPPVGVQDARAPLVIGLAAWQSLREGRAVRLDEVEAR